MKKIVILAVLVALLVPSFVFAGGHGYDNHRGGHHNDYRHGVRIDGNDIRDAALIGALGGLAVATVHAITGQPVVIQQPVIVHQPVYHPVCTLNEPRGTWSRNHYGQPIFVITHYQERVVPCSYAH